MQTFTSFLPMSSALNASVLYQFPVLSRAFRVEQVDILPLPKQNTLYQHVSPFSDPVTNYLATLSLSQIVIFVLSVAWALGPVIEKPPSVTSAVYHGYRSWLEPTFLVQARFLFNAQDIIASGFQKYKDTPFVVRRWDTDYTVMPSKYLDELRLYPATKLSSIQAAMSNLVHRWTYLTLLTESNLHFRVVQNKLTGHLHHYLAIAKKEFDYGWDQDVPNHEEWTEVDIQQMLRNLIARMSAKVFLGHPACRDPEWLDLSIGFSIEFFACAFLLRMFPSWLHAFIAPFLPLRWRVARRLKRAQKIIGPLMEKHRDCVRRREAGETGPAVEEDDTLLNWMMDNATEKENKVERMAIRQTALSLASIHTTSMAMSHLLFDLCAHPEWFPVLREEIAEVERDLGKLGERPDIGTKQWLPRFEKMDSILKESMRMNPPILLLPQRQAMVSMTLKDGTHIPAGTRIAYSNVDINNTNINSPSEFSPMRSYHKRHASGELSKHQAAQTAKDSVAFGNGKQACPGRFFAVGEIKMVLSRLLSEFEFKFPEGKGRPRNFTADEFVFPDPRAKLLMRRRRVPCDKCGRC